MGAFPRAHVNDPLIVGAGGYRATEQAGATPAGRDYTLAVPVNTPLSLRGAISVMSLVASAGQSVSAGKTIQFEASSGSNRSCTLTAAAPAGATPWTNRQGNTMRAILCSRHFADGILRMTGTRTRDVVMQGMERAGAPGKQPRIRLHRLLPWPYKSPYKSHWALVTICPLICTTALYGQVPQIAARGVVSAASYAAPVAPTGLIGIFGNNLATTTAVAGSLPLPLNLGGTSVTINGQPAPLLFVSPGQVNARIPDALAGLDYRTDNILASTVVVTSPMGSSAPATLSIAEAAPAFFTANGSGCGQAAALNITPGGEVSVNSPANSAAPGDYIALFGTGFGVADRQPGDGVASAGASPLTYGASLSLDGNPILAAYAGTAPTLVGVSQLNIQIPASTRNGCAVPVGASQWIAAPLTTLSVQAGRGQCVDPPVQSYGQISLSRTVASTSAGTSSTEVFRARFPSGPGLAPPSPEPVENVSNVPVTGPVTVTSETSINGVTRSCPVSGYADLSAGSIQIQPPLGTSIDVQPKSQAPGYLFYEGSLPSGFIGPGAYKLSGTQGSGVALNASVPVGSPIQLQTSFPAGTVLDASSPLSVTWTGGDAGTLVKLTVISGYGPGTSEAYVYGDASAGSLAIPPLCTPFGAGPGNVCSFGVPSSDNVQVHVDVLPPPNSIPAITAAGVTGPVQFTWRYTWTFSGLSLP